jgi:hypothetical protein
VKVACKHICQETLFHCFSLCWCNLADCTKLLIPSTIHASVIHGSIKMIEPAVDIHQNSELIVAYPTSGISNVSLPKNCGGGVSFLLYCC